MIYAFDICMYFITNKFLTKLFKISPFSSFKVTANPFSARLGYCSVPFQQFYTGKYLEVGFGENIWS